MDITAKVHEVLPTQQVTEKLQKRELIVEYADNPQYPEYIKFEAVQDRCNLLDSLRVGDMVEVFFNLKGRPWTDKTGKKSYFNSLQLCEVYVVDGGASAATTKAADDSDDLPF